MLFNSLEFAGFFVVVVVAYHVLPRRPQNVLLLVASYWFYAAWDPRFLTLIWLSTIVDYVCGRHIGGAWGRSDETSARRWLACSMIVNLGILGIFKYAGFFADSAASLAGAFGLELSGPTLDIVLPVGISFYTFQTMSYTIDVYRRKMEATDNLLDFALFVAFFPQLVAGPIERASHLLPQMQRDRSVQGRDVAEGVYLIAVGLVRKVVIADTAGIIADRYFASPATFGSVELFAGVVLYALQIYGDFAGYSNIARGSARLLGFDLMRNFQHPYFSRNITDFWRRWHMSLSTWLRDYLYIPLGGNQRGPRRTYVNLAATMLLGGLWHGASWNFVVWGGLHGVYLAWHRLRASGQRSSLRPVSATAATFVLVAFTWLPFRLESMGEVGSYLTRLFSFTPGDFSALVPVAVLVLVLLLIDLPQHLADDEFAGLGTTIPEFGVRLGTAVVLVVLFAGSTSTPFIYFQF
ncbi:MAG TPA: MBOAT family protein [Acidimicrobiia bacterium]